MSGVNKVIIIGRLGQDPEVKTITGGHNVANFSVATSEKYKDKETTTWHRVIAWNKTADLCAQYLHKGSQVYIDGKLQNREWEDPQGNKRFATEIVASSVQFLDSKQNNDQGGEPSFD